MSWVLFRFNLELVFDFFFVDVTLKLFSYKNDSFYAFFLKKVTRSFCVKATYLDIFLN